MRSLPIEGSVLLLVVLTRFFVVNTRGLKLSWRFSKNPLRSVFKTPGRIKRIFALSYFYVGSSLPKFQSQSNVMF